MSRSTSLRKSAWTAHGPVRECRRGEPPPAADDAGFGRPLDPARRLDRPRPGRDRPQLGRRAAQHPVARPDLRPAGGPDRGGRGRSRPQQALAPPPTSRRCGRRSPRCSMPIRPEPPSTIPDPFGGGTLHVAVTRFGVGDDHGVLVAGSRNADFPTEQDRLLLGVGANQTAIVVQRRRAEEQVQEQREWLRVTLASIGDAVIATDTEGRVTFLNAVAEELTGWTHGRRRGQAAGGGVSHPQRADPPAGREPGREGAAGGRRRRPGEPHGPDRQGRDRAAHRRQRRPDPGRGGQADRRRADLPGRDRAAAGRGDVYGSRPTPPRRCCGSGACSPRNSTSTDSCKW